MDAIIFLADGWGPTSGGINAFNYSLCQAMGKAFGDSINVVCVSHNISRKICAEELENNHLKLISMTTKADLEDAGVIVNVLKEKNIIGSSHGRIVWVGHDIYSGELACQCRELVENSQYAVIHHMAYREYYPMLSNDANKNSQKEKMQEDLILKADYVFANGPKLYRSARDLCLKERERKKVHQILPGLAEIEPRDFAPDHLSVIAFGRIEEEKEKNNNSIIKQTMLAAAAWGGFLKHIREKNMPVNSDMRVVGYDDDETIKIKNQKLKEFVSEYSGGVEAITACPYMENQDELYDMLKKQSLSLMLSREEGFGLVGLEAIAAGVPAIISKQSGLYEFLKEKRLENRVMAVDIQGHFQKPYFTNDDLDQVIGKINDYLSNKEERKKDALELRNVLLEQKLTWEQCAADIINILKLNAKKAEIENTFLKKKKGDRKIVNEIRRGSRIIKYREKAESVVRQIK